MSDKDLLPTPDTPAIAPDFVGVRIALSPAHAQRGPIALVGVFQLPKAAADAIDAWPHRALIVVATSSAGAMSIAPFRERVFFPDDLHRVGKMVRGYFSVEVAERDEALPQDHFWFSVSLGLHLSNVVSYGRSDGAGRG
jgi:hypothetical protein